MSEYEEQHPSVMTVDIFAKVLRSFNLALVEDGHYCNRLGRTGYRATYKDSCSYYWFSVSNTDAAFALDEVALAITASERVIQRENAYLNRKRSTGFEATVLSGGHAFMLNAAPNRR